MATHPHYCYGPADSLKVFDLFESPEAWETFGRILLPILEDVGVKVEHPDVQPLHNSFII